MKKILVILFMLCVGYVNAQQIPIRGTVTESATKAPLQGVTVSASSKTVFTDSLGKFTISANANEMLQFSYVGMLPKSVAATDNMSIELTPDFSNLNQVIVTGYQTQRKADLTGAVSVVDVDEMKKQAVANPIKALQGQVPGMSITSNGSPSAPATIRIRGVGTLNDNDPLYIIDGIPTKAGMHELNQADIESIQVLKDASSASVYGSRAANGVIIITTKHAKGIRYGC